MKHQELFNKLICKLEELVIIWDNYHKGEPLSHFDGVFAITFIESEILREAIGLIKKLYGKDPHEDLSSQINSLIIDFDDIYDIYSEYLMDIPVQIEGVSDIVSDCFLKYCNKVEEFDCKYLSEKIEIANKLLKMST